MDDDLQQLEAELKALAPAPLSPAAGRRVAAALARAEAPRRGFELRWLWLAALPAAAAAVMMFIAPRKNSPEAPATAPILKPVAAENVLVAATDEGLVTLDDGTPARRERLQFVETITWSNPRSNASLRWSVPREEVRVVPLSFQ